MIPEPVNTETDNERKEAPDIDRDWHPSDDEDEDKETYLEPPAPEVGMELLRAGVAARVKQHLEPTDCPRDMIEPFTNAVTEFTERMIIKFAAGQREHGGDFREINEDVNLEQEIIDLTMYGPILRRLRRAHLKLDIG